MPPPLLPPPPGAPAGGGGGEQKGYEDLGPPNCILYQRSVVAFQEAKVH
jgi:hypothetical protein